MSERDEPRQNTTDQCGGNVGADHDWRPFPGVDMEQCDRCGVVWFQDDNVWQFPYGEPLTEMPACRRGGKGAGA